VFALDYGSRGKARGIFPPPVRFPGWPGDGHPGFTVPILLVAVQKHADDHGEVEAQGDVRVPGDAGGSGRGLDRQGWRFGTGTVMGTRDRNSSGPARSSLGAAAVTALDLGLRAMTTSQRC